MNLKDFNDEELKNMKEHILLRIVIDGYYFNNQHLNALQVIAPYIGITYQSINNYSNGKGFLGVEKWLKLYELTKNKLIIRWFILKFENVGGKWK